MTAGPGNAMRFVLPAMLVVVLALVLVVGVRVVAGPGTELPAQAEYRATAAVPFRPDSPFRTPVPIGAEIDPASPAVTAHLVGEGRVYASLVEFGIPIYTADEQTPRDEVICLQAQWGPCPFAHRQTPIPDGARPHAGSDGAMVVVDEQAQLSYEFWQVKRVGGRWMTSFGAVNPLNGSGWGGAATGSGASRLAGVVRTDEIRRGVIDHALALQSNNACAGSFRAPAIKTDGRSDRPDCVPEGSRIRLDPTLDLDVLDLPPAQLAIARAFQLYGGYVVDVGGAPLSISFELAPDAEGTYPGEVYRQSDLRWDYDGLAGIPWDRLQLLTGESR
ncbi:hypothetical protein [Rhodococcus sp. IEGM 1408]|uniref:hypothetical protein n=1 Tax=Rhodococcus sp. IEGM 1408 TaxID=3082220 RepID=UPI002954EDA7|nr:hypothetical protein [Rhodococcus sp. IEGM 1408]MDV7999966.1 hypothetical protein [Rhodococcus sp. IEGM 1408]